MEAEYLAPLGVGSLPPGVHVIPEVNCLPFLDLVLGVCVSISIWELYLRFGLEEDTRYGVLFPHFLSLTLGEFWSYFSLFSFGLKLQHSDLWGACEWIADHFQGFILGVNDTAAFRVSRQEEEPRCLTGILQLILFMAWRLLLLFSFVDFDFEECLGVVTSVFIFFC